MDTECHSFGVGFILWQKCGGKKGSRTSGYCPYNSQGRDKVWHHHKNQFTFGSSAGFGLLQLLARIRAERQREQDGLVYMDHKTCTKVYIRRFRTSGKGINWISGLPKGTVSHFACPADRTKCSHTSKKKRVQKSLFSILKNHSRLFETLSLLE